MWANTAGVKQRLGLGTSIAEEVPQLPRFKRATLIDVAHHAGVSVTTASYVLNGRTSEMRIAPETEHRVRDAIEKLHYRPNRSARNLRRATTQTIGVISDSVASGAFSSQLLVGATAAARAHDHLLVIGETLGDREVERLLIEEMADRQVDGILYATLSASRVHLPQSLREGPTVMLNCEDPEAGLPAVLPDDFGGGRAAVRHLLENGIEGPVHVVGVDPKPYATAGPARLAGILEALADVDRELAGVVDCDWDVAPARVAMSDWLASGVVPSALICMNDRVAMGAYQALREYDLEVPSAVSVVSFDGSDLSTWLRPRLTSLALPFRDMGAQAVELLVDPDWSGTGVTTLPLVLQPGESVRQSTLRAG